jgi:CDP-glycerol glycerophosphotransferase
MKGFIKKHMPPQMAILIYRFINGNFNFLMWLFPIKYNKIVICNYHGKGYGDNGKYIAEELIRSGVDCSIVWLIGKYNITDQAFPENIKLLKYKSLRGLYELCTARIWIDNCRKEFYPPKRKNQIYIQTWHGGIPLKKIEKDAEQKLSEITIQIAKNDSKLADYFISNSDFCTKLYQNSFWYNGAILEFGSPRCDVLFNKDNNTNFKAREYFGIDGDTNVVLYAPTFRASLSLKLYEIDFNNLARALEKKFGGKWVMLVRLHPNISTKSNLMEYPSRVINASDYSDMYELLVASDVLLTDYSSTMFEFSMANKPVFLYAPDIETYSVERGFYFDIHDLPYPVAETNNQLFAAVENFNLQTYTDDLEKFYAKLGLMENGNASKRIVGIINNNICTRNMRGDHSSREE